MHNNPRAPESATLQPAAQPMNRRIKPPSTYPFWREVSDTAPKPSLHYLTNQPRQKFKLALKVSVGDKTGLTDFVISRHATGTTDEPTDWRQELQTGDRQHAQEQIQQKQK